MRPEKQSLADWCAEQGDYDFAITLQPEEGDAIAIDAVGDFFPAFVEGMLSVLDTGTCAIPPQETIEIAALLEAGTEALRQPGSWIALA